MLKQNLNISGNALSDTIPAELCGCHQLQRLVISGNRFAGAVPAGIWSGLPNLMQLDLLSNGFTGLIPPDLGDLKSLLGTLNISHNRFSGEIPNDLGHLTTMVRLDLRHNNLMAQIPQVGALSNQGVTAFLGNAKLCSFPLPNSCQKLSPAPPGVLVSVPRSGGSGGGEARKKGFRLEVIILIALADAAGVALAVEEEQPVELPLIGGRAGWGSRRAAESVCVRAGEEQAGDRVQGGAGERGASGGAAAGRGRPPAAEGIRGGGAGHREGVASERGAAEGVLSPTATSSLEEKLLVSDFVANGSLTAALRGGEYQHPPPANAPLKFYMHNRD
ncbi:hypothetical protein Taro_005440 [Colocasia esculenta]|uniref:Uncharacterized protein n=1 Tax=Colocasia esculenta TaxID=4460 RepID=A0A843TXZ0_COLES|nr:hypothetical protein [Colocasia esculenta]